NPPKTPGPDDNYNITFPQTGTTWSDLALVNGTLYAALANSSGDVNNGVFYSTNSGSNTPIWYVGDPFDRTQTPPVLVPDIRNPNPFPVGDLLPPRVPFYGNIKFA